MKKLLSIVAVLALVTAAIVLFPVGHVTAQQGAQWQTSDNVAPLDMGGIGSGCSVALTTGAFAANPATSGALTAPGMVRAQNQNMVYQVTTTAAASALTMDCDIIPQNFRTTNGKGVQITGIQVLYGVQTSALTSVTAANPLSFITYPVAGGAASGTVTVPTNTVTFNPLLASAQLATTTSGQCYNQTITFSPPISVNNNQARVIFEEVFNQTAASAAVYQICGVNVLYNNIVF